MQIISLKTIKIIGLIINNIQSSHTVYFATRIQNNSTTAIDNILADNSSLSLSSVSTIINDIAHDAQILTIKNLYAAINFL
jgi:hypothetical protein